MTAVVWAGALLALLVQHRLVWREVLTSVSHSSLGLWAGWLGSLVGGIPLPLLGWVFLSSHSVLCRCACLLAETSRHCL